MFLLLVKFMFITPDLLFVFVFFYCNIFSLFSAQICRPLQVVNGKVLGFGTLVGSVVRIECKKGYKLHHKEKSLFRTCQKNGRWSGDSQTVRCESKLWC